MFTKRSVSLQPYLRDSKMPGKRIKTDKKCERRTKSNKTYENVSKRIKRKSAQGSGYRLTVPNLSNATQGKTYENRR